MCFQSHKTKISKYSKEKGESLSFLPAHLTKFKGKCALEKWSPQNGINKAILLKKLNSISQQMSRGKMKYLIFVLYELQILFQVPVFSLIPIIPVSEHLRQILTCLKSTMSFKHGYHYRDRSASLYSTMYQKRNQLCFSSLGISYENNLEDKIILLIVHMM